MNLPGGEIFFGDFIRALSKIQIESNVDIDSVAGVLGFRFKSDRKETDYSDVIIEAEPFKNEGLQIKPSPKPSLIEPDKTPKLPPNPVEIVRSDFDQEIIKFDCEHYKLDVSKKAEIEYDIPKYDIANKFDFKHFSLFIPNWTKSILCEILSFLHEDGPLDSVEAVNKLASFEIFDRMPKLKIKRLFNKCQILFDVGIGMTPFLKDCRELISLLKLLFGKEYIEVLFFRDCPIFGVETESNFEIKSFEPPYRDTVIILLTDLGIANPTFSIRRSSPDDWFEFLKLIRNTGSNVVALVPYPSNRWPKPLINLLPIIQWDRWTTNLTVFNKLKLLHF